MKKEYINPVMEVVMLQSNNAILAGSDPQPVDENATSHDGVYDEAPTFFGGSNEDW